MKLNLSVLNDQQRKAVLNTNSPTLIIAGAGSGKTTTIAYKIAYLISRGIKANRILALTFSKNAADELKNRVKKLTGKNLYWIRTFHSFSLKLVQKWASLLGLPSDFKVADEGYTNFVLRRIADEFNLEIEITELKSLISFVKRGGGIVNEQVLKRINKVFEAKTEKQAVRSSDNLEDEIKKIFNTQEQAVKTNDELERMYRFSENTQIEIFKQIYKKYEEKLRKDRRLDYDDLQIYAVKLLREHMQVRQVVRRMFDHILVDEYQDTDAVQYELFKLVVGEKSNPIPFTVVGDPNQAIYTWRNARVENILHLDKEYDNVKVIKLEKNYRSTKNILAVANCIVKKISQDWPDKVVRLWTDKGIGSDVELRSFNHPDKEAEWIANTIFELNHKDIAILVRSSYMTESIERALYNAGIPYVVKGGKRFYEREEIDALVSYLRFALDLSDQENFEKSVSFPSRRVGDKTIEKIKQKALSSDIPSNNWLQACIEYLQDHEHSGLREYVNSVINFQDRLETEPLYKAYTKLIEETGMYDYIKDRYIATATDKIAAIERLLDVLESQRFTPQQFLTFIDNLKNQPQNNENAVVISTIHAVKGLEYTTVFVPSLNEGFLPHKHSLEDEESLKEEWRVFYVAITRPKTRLFLSFIEELRLSRFIKYLVLEKAPMDVKVWDIHKFL